MARLKMNLKKMSEGEKRLLIRELTKLILKYSIYTYNRDRDRRFEEQFRERMEDVELNETVETNKKSLKGMSDKEIIAEIGLEILEDIEPYNIRRMYLFARASWREENEIARKAGKELPHPGMLNQNDPELIEDEWAEAHFGDMKVWSRIKHILNIRR